MSTEHSFQALAFPENVSLRSLAAAFPEARRGIVVLIVLELVLSLVRRG